MTTTKIAVIGSDQKAVEDTAKHLAEKYNARILNNQSDDMSELLKLDLIKHFSAYQLHLLLNRIHNMQEPGNIVVCDTLFNDHCAMSAALSAEIITASEYKLYKKKHDEFMQSFKGYDYVYYIEDELSINQIQAPMSELSVSYWKLCINSFYEEVAELKDMLKERFICLSAALTDSDNQEKIKPSDAIDEQIDIEAHEPTLSEHIKEALPHVQIVESLDTIKQLIKQYQEDIDISSCLPCICIETEDATCLKLAYDEKGEEFIRCTKPETMDEIIAFFNE